MLFNINFREGSFPTLHLGRGLQRGRDQPPHPGDLALEPAGARRRGHELRLRVSAPRVQLLEEGDCQAEQAGEEAQEAAEDQALAPDGGRGYV